MSVVLEAAGVDEIPLGACYGERRRDLKHAGMLAEELAEEVERVLSEVGGGREE